MQDTEESYNDLKKRIEDGKVVEFGGRTASTVAELDLIRELPDKSAKADFISYAHTAIHPIDALTVTDEIGARSQPFTPEVITDNKPGNDEAGPTTVSGADTNTPTPKPLPVTAKK